MDLGGDIVAFALFEGVTPLVQASAAPADAAYSGLLECPCTDRVVKQVRHVSQCRHVAQCRHVSQCRHVARSITCSVVSCVHRVHVHVLPPLTMYRFIEYVAHVYCVGAGVSRVLCWYRCTTCDVLVQVYHV